MADIIEDYLRQIENRLRVEEARKAQIIREIRTHLEERVAEISESDPARPREEIQREVIHDFGNPHDLALAYTPDGNTILRKETTGETVLRIGRAVGRGAKTTLKVVAITVGVCLVVGSALAVWAYYEFKPVIERNIPYPVYSFTESCNENPCTSAPIVQRFYVHPDAREVRFDLYVHHYEGATGSVRVLVQDPAGKTLYDRNLSASRTHRATEHAAWQPQGGDWSVTYEFTEFRGWLDVEAMTVGLPKGALDT